MGVYPGKGCFSEAKREGYDGLITQSSVLSFKENTT